MTDQGATDLRDMAVRVLADYDAGRPGMLFGEVTLPSEAAAYGIQECVAELREARGDRVIGYKVGCVSATMQQQLGVDHPVYGRLFASERHPSGARLSASNYDHLAIEGEMATRLGDDLSWPLPSDAQVVSKLEAVFPVIELHNYVFRGSGPSVRELIACNCIHAGIVAPLFETGPVHAVESSLTLRINGEIVETTGVAVLTDRIVSSLRWLAETLNREGKALLAGQIILTGSSTRLIPVRPPSAILVEAAPFGEVEARVGLRC